MELRKIKWHVDEDGTMCAVQPHGDMQWRKTDGTFGAYEGPLDDLGYGIPRNPRTSWGLRRALFDLAFGYVSGFPIRDVITFSLRSLFPSDYGEAGSNDD